MYFNKALLKVGDQAAISHIIDLFPSDSEFVVALGHLGDLVRQYLTMAHPDLNVTYVEIDKYSVPGSGPAYALEKCKEHLQEPFFFVACDTIIHKRHFLDKHQGDVDYLAYDYIDPKHSDRYCTLQLYLDQVISLMDKVPNGTDKAFTGFAHIRNWSEFWKAMTLNKSQIYQEFQLSPVFAMMPGMQAYWMRWNDVGSEQGLLAARARFPGIQNLDKLDEELYVVDGSVVKYFHNKSIVRSRLRRTQILGDLVPKLTGHTANYYRYRFVSGEDLFRRDDMQWLMEPLLNWAKEKLWVKPEQVDEARFHKACRDFYYVKTIGRINQFFSKTGIEDRAENINGYPTAPIQKYLELINWTNLCEDGAVATGFHGDFQPANIVVNSFKDFKLIDWRQDFGGIFDYGDQYYDFAKLYCSLLMPHPSIKDGKYSLRESAGEVFADIYVPDDIRVCREIFENWLTRNGYSIGRTSLLAAIVMLNMAPLHEHPLDQWLYYYSKNLLGQVYPTGTKR